MKQFNLQEFLANQSRKVVTRCGKPVRIVCTDAKGDCPVFGLALGVDGSEFPIMCSAIGESEFEEDDLFFDTVTNEGWVNLYRNDRGAIFFGQLRSTEKEALEENYEGGYKRIAITKITWEE